MSRNASQSSKWDFTVTQHQLPSPIAGRGNLPFFGNFRDDTGECLGVTTEQYGIVQNSELMDAARAALAQRGLVGYSERVLTAGDCGQRFYAEFTFSDKKLASGVGDVFGYRLVLKNSFDRSLRAAFALGFLRLVCLNGASTLEKEFSVTRKHSSKVTVDFLGDAIDHAMSQGQAALGTFDRMAGTNITDEQGVNILKQLVLANVLSGSLSEAMEALWLAPRRDEDKARNLYNLYNAVTEHLTHQVSSERFEYAAKVSNNVLVKLANASRRLEILAKLILPVPEDKVNVVVNAQPIAEAVGATVIEAEVV